MPLLIAGINIYYIKRAWELALSRPMRGINEAYRKRRNRAVDEGIKDGVRARGIVMKSKHHGNF